MVRQPGFHGGCRSERGALAPEIVKHHVQCNRSRMVLDLRGKGVCQSGEAPHGHAHREVLPFDIAGAGVLRIRRTDSLFLLTADALRRAVARFAGRFRPVDLVQHAVVDVLSKGIIDGVDVDLEAISGQLDVIGETARKILNKLCGATSIPLAEEPARNELCVRIDGNPHPNVASYRFVRDVWPEVPLFAIAE